MVVRGKKTFQFKYFFGHHFRIFVIIVRVFKIILLMKMNVLLNEIKIIRIERID